MSPGGGRDGWIGGAKGGNEVGELRVGMEVENMFESRVVGK